MTKSYSLSIAAMGLLISIFTIIAYNIGLTQSEAAASTMAFTTLCLARLFHFANCRGKEPVNVLGFTSNKFGIFAFFAGIVFLAAALFITPLHSLFDVTVLSLDKIGMIAALAIAPTIIIQIVKNITYFKKRSKAKKA